LISLGLQLIGTKFTINQVLCIPELHSILIYFDVYIGTTRMGHSALLTTYSDVVPKI